jgi:16S rRNA C1402 (ribose-2'-O) methylase RsmI
LEDLLAGLGDRSLFLGRELTKVHEELVVRPISEQLATLREPRGEYTLVISASPKSAAAHAVTPSPAKLALEFGHLTDSGGLSRRSALKALASKHTISARDVFALLEQAKDSGE